MPEPTDLSAPEQDVAISPMRRTNLNGLFLPSTGPVMFFDSGEHAVIPLSLPFPGGVKYDAATYQMTYDAPGQNGVALSYGQMMALAGDFYADPNNPISNQSSLSAQMHQIQTNVNSLLATPASRGEAQSILAVIHKEIAAAVPMAWRGLPASNIYATQYFDYQYNGITGGSYTSFKSSPRGRYLLIAATNWDHFGQDAITCYIAAHTLALSIANDGSTEMALQQAYAVNAFADHYLSDLFSAGHIRTPRRQMYQRQFPTGVQHPVPSDYDSPTSGMSGSIAKAMHDEDSVNGLWVTNPAGDQWLCMGDGQYRNVANYANAALVQLAVNQSIQEVFAAFHGGPIPTSANYAALRLIPKLQTGSVNDSPMLVPTSNDVLIRTQLSNLNDQQHTTFNLVSTYGSLPSTPVKGPGLLGPQVTTLPSIPEGVVPAQLGSYGAAELAQPPFSFGVSSSGAIHLAYLKGLQIVYAILSSGGSPWKWIDTISSGASAPGISPHPVNLVDAGRSGRPRRPDPSSTRCTNRARGFRSHCAQTSRGVSTPTTPRR